MTVYTGSTFQTCALRVWGVWVSMRDFHAATLRYNRDLPPGFPPQTTWKVIMTEPASSAHDEYNRLLVHARQPTAAN